MTSSTEGDATPEGSGDVIVSAETFRCQACDVRRPRFTVGDIEASAVLYCMGECGSNRRHIYDGSKWEPARLEFRCDHCGYYTVFWEDPLVEHMEVAAPKCVNCGGFSGDGEELHERQLLELTGVTGTVANRLVSSGYNTREAILRATSKELAENLNIGQVRAARIRANFDEESIDRMTLVTVVTADDADD